MRNMSDERLNALAELLNAARGTIAENAVANYVSYWVTPRTQAVPPSDEVRDAVRER